MDNRRTTLHDPEAEGVFIASEPHEDLYRSRQPYDHKNVDAQDRPPPAWRLTGADRSARSQKRSLLISGIVSGAILATSGALWATTTAVDSGINRIDAGLTGSAPGGPLNILLVGVDKREGLTRRQQNHLHLGREKGSRSDTIMVIHLSADHKKITVVSVPRDSYVQIPGHGSNKINAAYSIGGPKLAVQTVQQNTGLKINHFVEVNVLGFVEVVDRLGGVEVCTTQPINDSKIKFKLAPGKHTLNGAQALSFARTRATARSDFDRIDRQQEFLSAVFRKALSADTLTNPAKLAGFVGATLKTISVDKGFGRAAILGLAGQLKDINPANVTFAKPPIANGSFQTPDGQSAVLWDQVQAKTLFEQIKNDQPILKATTPKPAAPTDDATVVKIAPARISLTVKNGTGIVGKGATAVTDLRRVGFRIPAPPGNTAQPDYADTVIQYGPGRADSAATLAAAIPGAKLEQITAAGNQITVIVGRSYAGTKPVKIAGPSTTPTADSGESAVAKSSEAKSAAQNLCK